MTLDAFSYLNDSMICILSFLFLFQGCKIIQIFSELAFAQEERKASGNLPFLL